MILNEGYQIDGLPIGSILLMNQCKAPFLRTEDGWISTRFPHKPVYDYIRNEKHLPAVVLWNPEQTPVVFKTNDEELNDANNKVVALREDRPGLRA